MDFLASLFQITLYLLPFCGIVLIIYLIVLIIKVLKSVESLNAILDKTKITVDQVNTSLIEIQKPLATVVKISTGVELVYDYSEKAMQNLVVRIAEFIQIVKTWIEGLLKKNNEGEENE